MAQNEQARLQVLNSLLAEHQTLDQAASLMGVSARHTRRILAAYRKEGAPALVVPAPQFVIPAIESMPRTPIRGRESTH